MRGVPLNLYGGGNIKGLGDLHPGDPGYYVLAPEDKVPVYGEDDYVAQPNSAPIGTGGSVGPWTPGYHATAPIDDRAPIGTGGSPDPGQSTGTGGYTPGLEYGPDMVSFSGYTGKAGEMVSSAGAAVKSSINVVTEGATSLLSGTFLGIPRWLALLAGVGVVWKLSKGNK